MESDAINSGGLCVADFSDVDVNEFTCDDIDVDRFAFVEDELWGEITRVPVSLALRRKMRYVLLFQIKCRMIAVSVDIASVSF
jgi:hypothetical protein